MDREIYETCVIYYLHAAGMGFLDYTIRMKWKMAAYGEDE